MSDMPPALADPDLLVLADQCVMCGLCLPHCPTYRLDRHEAESPRGRIAYARVLARGAETLTPTAVAHLDHCLGCLACQKVCPSKVRYDGILARTRALLAAGRPRRIWRGLTPGRLTLLARIGVLTRAGHWLPMLARLLPRSSLAHRVAVEMPRAAPHARRSAQVSDVERRGSLTLFPGCVARVLDRDTLLAAQDLLEALGYHVVVPKQAVCCGALPLHAGESDAARTNAAATRTALEALPAQTVLVSASGCLGSLRDTTLAGSALAVDDVMTFIARDPELGNLRFRPLARRIALHVPCTQASIGDGGVATRAVLARIPQLEVLTLPEQPRCCGAAGTYFIEQPERADRLRAEKLDQATSLAPELVLTSNVGCRIFLANGLRQRASDVPVLHPLALLARQLETSKP